MPEPNGFHPPESRGTDYPSPGYQAPVDNFPRSTGVPIKGARRVLTSTTRGYQMPEPSVWIAAALSMCGRCD